MIRKSRRRTIQLTKLDDADLAGANLTEANLCGVDLRRVKGLTLEQIQAAHIDADTKIPTYLAAGMPPATFV